MVGRECGKHKYNKEKHVDKYKQINVFFVLNFQIYSYFTWREIGKSKKRYAAHDTNFSSPSSVGLGSLDFTFCFFPKEDLKVVLAASSDSSN